MNIQNKLKNIDIIVIAILFLIFLLFFLKFINLSNHPFEDAAMLMRYSEHLAQGYGIVWNIGGNPVDGATDFLFMVVLAAFNKTGLSLENSVILLGIISHFSTVIIIYYAIISVQDSGRLAAIISGVYFALGPGIFYIQAYFGTPFFALFAAITWFFALKIVKKSNSNKTAIMFALSALIMGLIRPEGVFLAVFMLMAIIYMKGYNASKNIIFTFLIIFLIIGGLYFIWRWNYFGHPFPNPFYKKGGGSLYYDDFIKSLKNIYLLIFPFIIPYILAFRKNKTAKEAIFSLIPILGFLGIWILLSNEMNYLSRFQYAILPIILMAWPPLVKNIFKEWKLSKKNILTIRNVIILITALLFLSYGVYNIVNYKSDGSVNSFNDGRYDVALMLSKYNHNYTIATTEAGLLPFYSKWNAIDTYGLNDPWIAHNGNITESYLDVYKPNVIMFHAYFSPLTNETKDSGWNSMVLTLKSYAEKNGYILAAAFGETPYEAHYYYVRSDFPESYEIVQNVRNMNYIWYTTGGKSKNYVL